MRTLRRPMFRIGGSAGSGITSGLAPRQGYQGTDDASDQNVMSLAGLKGMTIQEIQQMAKAKWGVNNYVKRSKTKIGRHKKRLNKSEKSSYKKYRGQGR